MFDIPLIRPVMDDNVKRRVLAVLESGQLSDGAVTHELEERVAAWLGAPQCVAVTSCTTGLELALRAVGVGPGDRVLLPAYTYPATADAVLIVGGVPVLVDVDPATMLMDATALELALADGAKAVMPVSLFGNPVDYAHLNTLKRAHGFFVIEDAACALGARFAGARVGVQADISVFSLHPRKFITSGEGGLITTSDQALADFMRSYKHFGMPCAGGVFTPMQFERPGTNYKLSNVLSAIALGQLDRVDELLEERIALAERYRELLGGQPGVTLPLVTPGGAHSWQTFCVCIPRRDQVLAVLRGRGIEVQIGSIDIARQRAFQGPQCDIRGACPGAAQAAATALALPLFHGMTRTQQERVAKELLQELADLPAPLRAS